MKLYNKIVFEHQSITCLDIPSQLLTVTNGSINQRKQMIAPGGTCSIEDVFIGIGVSLLVFFGVMWIVAYCCSLAKNQERDIIRDRNALEEADRGTVSVISMPIADGETLSPRRHHRHHRHHRRHHKEDTVIQIRTDTSQKGNASPGFVGDI